MLDVEFIDDRESQILGLRTKFLMYPAAEIALKHITDTFKQPRSYRPRCFLLLGETNNGKTHILREFVNLHPGEDNEAAEAVDRPVIHISAPPEGYVRTLYLEILEKLGGVTGKNTQTGDLYMLVTRMLKACGVKMIIIDEFHNILINKRIQKNTTNFLNQFRHCLNLWQIPVVCAGLRDQVVDVIDYDPQIESRFRRRFELPLWSPGSLATKSLMASLDAALPLMKGPGLGDQAVRRAIVSYSKGRMGDIVDITIDAAIDALNSTEEITLDQLRRLNTK